MIVGKLRRVLCGLAVSWLGLGSAFAQTSGWLDENRRFEEGEVAMPESFNANRLISFVLSSGSELRFGVDPDTVSLDKDGVVRYVLVASGGSGVSNVLYQGIRCGAGEFRTYATWHAGEGWRKQERSAWTPWLGTAAGLPAQKLARDAFCEGRTPNGPVTKMISELRYGRASQYR